jgi:hypothetical protein
MLEAAYCGDDGGSVKAARPHHAVLQLRIKILNSLKGEASMSKRVLVVLSCGTTIRTAPRGQFFAMVAHKKGKAYPISCLMGAVYLAKRGLSNTCAPQPMTRDDHMHYLRSTVSLLVCTLRRDTSDAESDLIRVRAWRRVTS